jgi:pimeloyl-ACP methyl ester carboxylesterase
VSFETPSAPPPWRERFVSASDGTRLYTRLRDDPATSLVAVLCDGIACDGFIWRHLVDDLQGLAGVLHWNYRGHGRSAAPVDIERVDIDAFVDDLRAVRAVAHAPQLLVGHSFGCQLVLESYRRDPAGVAGLVLICGSPGRITHSFKGTGALAQALPGLIERVHKNPRIARALWSNVPPEISARVAIALGEVDGVVEPEDIIRYSEHVAAIDLEMFLRMLFAIGEHTASDMLPNIAVPTLVLAGELDTFTPTHLAEEMAAAIPESELVVFSGGTHVVPIERRGEVRERLSAFIRERVAPRIDGGPDGVGEPY